MTHKYLTFSILQGLLAVAFMLAACAPGGTTPTNTPTPAGEESGSAPVEGSDSRSSAGSSGSGPQAGSEESSTGLVYAPRGNTPSNAPRPTRQSSAGTAVLWIEGDLPVVLTGGECSPLGNELYLSAPPDAGSPPPYASLIIYEGTSSTRTGTLVWATTEENTDSAIVSTQDVFVITLNDDGFSGSFEGTAHRVAAGVPVTEVINVRGLFTCVAALVRIEGDHPLDLSGAECQVEPTFQLSVGTRGENAALLILSGPAVPGETIDGGISWRVGGVNYTSTWLSTIIRSDGISGDYVGEATGPDGRSFPIVGSFNCLGN